jgi:hypothetical protein
VVDDLATPSYRAVVHLVDHLGEADVLLCCLPVGGQAHTADGATFTPPWAE